MTAVYVVSAISGHTKSPIVVVDTLEHARLAVHADALPEKDVQEEAFSPGEWSFKGKRKRRWEVELVMYEKGS